MPHGQVLEHGKLSEREPGAFADERSGGDVPLLDRPLEVGVVAARGRPRQIERGAAEAADVAHAWHEPCEHLRLGRTHARVVREPGRDHRRRELARAGQPSPPMGPAEPARVDRRGPCSSTRPSGPVSSARALPRGR